MGECLLEVVKHLKGVDCLWLLRLSFMRDVQKILNQGSGLLVGYWYLEWFSEFTEQRFVSHFHGNRCRL